VPWLLPLQRLVAALALAGGSVISSTITFRIISAGRYWRRSSLRQLDIDAFSLEFFVYPFLGVGEFCGRIVVLRCYSTAE
jgi:hypothetical protein